MKFRLFFCLAIVIFLFNTVLAQTVPVNLEVQKGYLLGPGDEITGKVLGEPQFDFVTTVNENGMVELPFAEKPLIARCRSEREIRTDITTLLAKYLRDPHLGFSVKRNRAPATISGEVNAPQPVILMRKATLIELLSVAGGVKEEAGGMIQVFRTQPPVCADDSEDANWKSSSSDPTDVPSRMFSLSSLRLGKDEANPIIYPGDVIVVQKASPVYITGQVVSPQGIYLKEGGMTLTEALAKIGGVSAEAKTKNIKIYRLKPNSKDREIIAANVDQIKKGTQKDVLLQAYDIVEVDKAKDSIGTSILKMVLGVGKTAVTSLTNTGMYRVIY